MTDTGLARLNQLPADTAVDAAVDAAANSVRGELRACCASSAWLAGLLAGRPYAARSDLLDTSEELLAELDWADVRQAVDVHPRIGERVAGHGQEATWSRREQSAMLNSAKDVRSALVAANQAYEDRFGHVFLIFASGRTDVEMLADAQSRVGNDEATEHTVVRRELARIVGRRLTVLLDAWEAAT